MGMTYRAKADLLEKAVWEDDSEGVGGTLFFPGKRRLRIPDQEEWTEWKTNPIKMVPGYILDRL